MSWRLRTFLFCFLALLAGPTFAQGGGRPGFRFYPDLSELEPAGQRVDLPRLIHADPSR